MYQFLIANFSSILAGIVIPVLVSAIFMAFRFGRGYYSSGLDGIAGLSSLDLGMIGLAEVLRRLLSSPFRQSPELVFLSLGLLGMLLFVVLLPMERALTRYNAYVTARDQGYNVPGVDFPYVRVFLSWVSVTIIVSSNVLIFFAKASQ